MPTGANTTTITVQGTPGQTELSLQLYGPGGYWYSVNFDPTLPLTEGPAGTYTAQWSAVGRRCCWSDPVISYDGTHSIYVYGVGGLLATGAVTVTGVNQVTVAPQQFTPGGGNFTTITARGGQGLALEARIFNTVTGVRTTTLPMTEASGVYAADWDGRDSNGNFAGANSYRVQIFNRDSGQRYTPETSITVQVAVFGIAVLPDPFVPTGSNTVTLTIQADPGLSGLTASLTSPQGQTVSGIHLTESGSIGTYVGTWDGQVNGTIPQDGIYTIRVFDGSGNQFPTTGRVTLSSARSLTVTPNPFEPGPGRTATISVEVASGLQLEARIGSNVIIPLQGSGSTYTATWNGTDTSGAVLPPGSYTVFLWNSATNTRYTLSTGLTLTDTTPPETTITSGPAEGATVVGREVTFTWIGMDNASGVLTFSSRLDNEGWSPFTAATSRTLSGLALGARTFEVRAQDTVDNIDPTPAIRHFQVAERSYVFDVSTDAPAYAEGAVVQFRAFVFDANNPAQPRTSSEVGARLTVVAPNAQTVFGPTLLSFNAATGQFSGTLNTSGFVLGTYQATFTFLDSAGNVVGTRDVSFELRSSFSVSIRADKPEYDRGQSVELSGQVRDGMSVPLAGVPVTLVVTSRGFSREFSVVTNPSGNYQFIFNPLANEAGMYSAAARVQRDGLLKQTTASFLIHGLLLEPALVTLSMSMNSSQSVPLRLHNIGETNLTDIILVVQDTNPGDSIDATLSAGSVATLPPGAVQEIAIVITAPAGSPPPVPAVFTVVANAAQGVSETASVRATLQAARGVPVVQPAELQLGMHPGASRSASFTVRNEGFAPMLNSRVQLADPTTFNWVLLQDNVLGDVAPGESRSFGVTLLPPAGLTLGVYIIRLDLVTSTDTIPIFVTIELTSSQVGPVAVQVSDDTGADVSGAQVTLVSTTLYQHVTPSGVEAFNNIYQGMTDTSGHLLFQNVAAGNYAVQVMADRHASYEAQATVQAGTQVQTIEALLSTKVVDFIFKVTPTTVADQYDVSLVITYSTDLVKPALIATPGRLDVSFFPEETVTGEITITNSHTQTTVTDIMVDASQLDPAFKQFKMVFSQNGMEASAISIPELAPKSAVTIPYKATLPVGADLTSRVLGSVAISGKYIFSLRGEARQGTTESAIFVSFGKPQSLRLMPPVCFLNDEIDGIVGNLAYQGTTSQITLQNQRTIPLDFLSFGGQPSATPPVKAVQLSLPQNVPLDALPTALLTGATEFWSSQLSTNHMETRGASATFDITGLQQALEAHYSAVVTSPPYLGAVGQWGDATMPQGFLFPLCVTTVRPQEVIITTGGAGPLSNT